MTGPTLWLILVALGFVLLRAMARFGYATVRALAIRAAALSFLGAGTIGASGWIDDVADKGVAQVSETGAQATAAAVGTGAIWLAWVVLAVMWVATMLPEAIFKGDVPDWLSLSGLLLPSLMARVPGPVGDFFAELFDSLGTFMVDLVRGSFV